MVNSSKKENDRFFSLSRKVNGTHFLRVDGLKGLMFHFGTLVLSNCCKFCDCWGERDKPGVARRRLQKPMSLGHTRASTVATLAYRVLSTRSGGAWKTKGDPRLRGDDIRLEPGGVLPLNIQKSPQMRQNSHLS